MNFMSWLSKFLSQASSDFKPLSENPSEMEEGGGKHGPPPRPISENGLSSPNPFSL